MLNLEEKYCNQVSSQISRETEKLIKEVLEINSLSIEDISRSEQYTGPMQKIIRVYDNNNSLLGELRLCWDFIEKLSGLRMILDIQKYIKDK